ncbi:hypothetical protein ACU7M0_37600, partial [Burkholderia cenocepacia]
PDRLSGLPRLVPLALGPRHPSARRRVMWHTARHATQVRSESAATGGTAGPRRSLRAAAVLLRGTRAFASALSAEPSGAAWLRYLASLDLDALQSPVRSLGRLEPSAAEANQATRQALQRAAETGTIALDAKSIRDTFDTALPRTELTLYLPNGAN